MKLCKGCKSIRTLDEFYNDSSKKDGKSTRCKQCKNAASSIYVSKHRNEVRKISKNWRERNIHKKRNSDLEWRKSNPDKYKAIRKKYRENHKETLSESFKKWRVQNKKHLKVKYQEWSIRNRGLKTFLQSKRHADILLRTPVYANLEKIKQFYIEAERLSLETGVRHHVDHIIPLRGVTVSGFHHEGNLQILTAEKNLAKSNKLITVEA